MTDHDTPTDPTGFEIPVCVSSEPPPDDARRFADLVAESMDVRMERLKHDLNESIAQVIMVEAATRKTVKTLADAFQRHDSDEQKHRAVMLKALAVKGVMPTAALVLSLLALGLVTLGPQQAQAQAVCPPGIGGAP